MHRHIRILQVGLLAAATGTAAASVVPLGFSDGSGTNAVDQYAGVAGGGWVDGNGASPGSGWVSGTAGSSQTYSVGIASTTPLLSSAGNYLTSTLSLTDDVGSGQSRVGNIRKYDGGLLSTTNTYQFDIRVDHRHKFEGQFEDALILVESSAAGTSNGGSNTDTTWQINMRGNNAITYQSGTSSTSTGVTWTTGVTYRFIIQSNPATEKWSFVLKNASTDATLFTTPLPVDWRNSATNIAAAHGGYLSFAAGLTRGANQAGSSVTYSLDNISVTSVPEPAAVSLLSAVACPLLHRRRRGLAL